MEGSGEEERTTTRLTHPRHLNPIENREGRGEKRIEFE